MAKQNWKPGNMLYPVPAVMVSCQRPGEKPNIVTIAWAGTICSDPAMVSISVRPERYSYDIIKETGEFTINLVTEKLAFATDYCGVKSGRDVDKFIKPSTFATDFGSSWAEIKVSGFSRLTSVTLHQDIYGSAEHSNEPEITNLRYTLVPYFEANDVDVVLTGHDHATGLRWTS